MGESAKRSSNENKNVKVSEARSRRVGGNLPERPACGSRCYGFSSSDFLMIFLVWAGRSKENGPGFYDRLRKGRVDGGTEEKDEHVPPHSLAQRL